MLPEVVAIGKDLGLERQEGPARIDQVDARQPVLERDLLRAQVLLDGHRVVGAALDGRVVGDDDAGRALDPADAGDDPGPGRIVVVEAGRRQRAQLQEGGPRVQQAVDPFADGELAAFTVSRDRSVVAAGATPGDRLLARAKVGYEHCQRVVVGTRLGGRGVEPAAEDGHGPMIVGSNLGSAGIAGERASVGRHRGNADGGDPEDDGEPDPLDGQLAAAAARSEVAKVERPRVGVRRRRLRVNDAPIRPGSSDPARRLRQGEGRDQRRDAQEYDEDAGDRRSPRGVDRPGTGADGDEQEGRDDEWDRHPAEGEERLSKAEDASGDEDRAR